MPFGAKPGLYCRGKAIPPASFDRIGPTQAGLAVPAYYDGEYLIQGQPVSLPAAKTQTWYWVRSADWVIAGNPFASPGGLFCYRLDDPGATFVRYEKGLSSGARVPIVGTKIKEVKQARYSGAATRTLQTYKLTISLPEGRYVFFEGGGNSLDRETHPDAAKPCWYVAVGRGASASGSTQNRDPEWYAGAYSEDVTLVQGASPVVQRVIEGNEVKFEFASSGADVPEWIFSITVNGQNFDLYDSGHGPGRNDLRPAQGWPVGDRQDFSTLSFQGDMPFFLSVELLSYAAQPGPARAAVRIRYKVRRGAQIGHKPAQRHDGAIDSIVVFDTTKGRFVIALWPSVAPATTANFVKLSSAGFYDGTSFHRIVRGFIVQGGDPLSRNPTDPSLGTGGPGYTIPDEFNDRKHVRGVISMAHGGAPNSGGSQFFILLGDAPALDGKYTAFGQVVQGMEVIDAIASTRLTSNPLMAGEVSRPTDWVTIKAVRVGPIVPEEHPAGEDAGH